MSRFADPTATAVLDLGECRCPGTPHDRDEYVYRTQLGDAEEGRTGAYGWATTGNRFFDWAAARAYLIAEVAGVSWNFMDTGPDALVPVPMRVETAALLDEQTLNAMAQAVDAAQSGYRATLPNASAGPSRDTSRATGSPTRRTPKKR